MSHALWTRRSFCAAAMCLPIGKLAAQPRPVSYPDKPVRIVVPAQAGGTSDYVARLVAQRLSERLNGSFIIENKPGAASNIGADFVAKSAADGYTLLVSGANTHAINPHLFKNLKYRHIEDFAPITPICNVPNLLVVNPSLGVKTVPELIALLKKNPDKFSYGSTGRGTTINLAALLFMTMTGIRLAHVPYNGSGQMVTDLVGGQIQLSFDNIVSSLPQAQSGGLVALAVTTTERSPGAPDIPPMKEFLPGFDVGGWQGLFAPAGTPPAIVSLLNREAVLILQEPETVSKLQLVGATPMGSSPDEFSKFIVSETARWKKIITDAGIDPE